MQQSQIQNNQEIQGHGQSQNRQQQSQNSQNNPQSVQEPQTPMLKIYADNAQPKIMCVLRIVIFCLIASIFFIRFACIFFSHFLVPSTYVTLSNQIAFRGNNSTKGCNPSGFDAQSKLYCLNFSNSNPVLGLLMADIVKQNQLSLLYMQITKYFNNTQTTIINQDISIQYYQITPLINTQTNYKQFFRRKLLYNESMKYEISTNNYLHYQKSKNGFIFRFLFAYTRIDNIYGHDDFLLLLRFSNYSQIAPGINQINLQGLTINPPFTRFTIIVRGIYCLITLITSILFLRRYFQLKPEDRILQIRLIAIASVLIFFFNDPFYAITILVPNPASVFFSSIFVVTFLVFIQLLWVFFLRRIYYETQQKKTQLFQIKRSWPFYLFFAAIFIVSTVLYLQYTYYALNQIPLISFADIKKLKVLPTIIILALMMAAIVIYQLVIIGFLLKKYCCQESNEMLWRHKNYLSYYPFFLLIFVIFFAAGASMPYSYQGTWILYGYSFMNIFIIVVQFLYYTPYSELSKHSNQNQLQQHIPLQKFSVSSDLIGPNIANQQIQANTNLQQQS